MDTLVKLPAINVKNKVVWLNENLCLPFDIKLNESCTKFGLLLIPEDAYTPFYDCLLEVTEGHGRTADIGKIIFSDKEGNVYRYVDIKGVGWIGRRKNFQGAAYEPVEGDGGDDFIVQQYSYWDSANGARGLLDLKNAFHDKQISEKFHNLGIRTHRCITIIELEEIYFHGYLYPVKEIKEEFKKKGSAWRAGDRLPDDYYPVLQVRAFGTKNRIRNGVLTDITFSKESLFDAINIVKTEINRNDFALKDYLTWFAETLGKNIGIMHQNGYLHNYLNGHNITLDCRIVDLDSVTKISEHNKNSIHTLQEKIQTDISNPGEKREDFGAIECLRYLIKNSLKLLSPQLSSSNIDLAISKLEKIFLNSYQKYCPKYYNQIKI